MFQCILAAFGTVLHLYYWSRIWLCDHFFTGSLCPSATHTEIRLGVNEWWIFFFSGDILHHANIDSFFQCSVPLWKQFTSISLKFKARSWTLTPATQYQFSLSMTFGASLRMRTTIHFRFHSQNCLQRRCPETSVKIENRLQSIDRSTTATTGTVRRPLRGQENFRSHKVELTRS